MLMPTPMAAMVRKELGFLRVFALVLARRTQEERPGDIPLGYGHVSRRVLLSVALVPLGAGTTVLVGLASSTTWIVLGSILLYAAVLTAAVGLASKVRPHVLRGDSLLVRWGLHQELAAPRSGWLDRSGTTPTESQEWGLSVAGQVRRTSRRPSTCCVQIGRTDRGANAVWPPTGCGGDLASGGRCLLRFTSHPGSARPCGWRAGLWRDCCGQAGRCVSIAVECRARSSSSFADGIPDDEGPLPADAGERPFRVLERATGIEPA